MKNKDWLTCQKHLERINQIKERSSETFVTRSGAPLISMLWRGNIDIANHII
jgi:hypothetical protein